MSSFYRRRGKRVFDVLLASLLIAITLPVSTVAAIGVRIRLGSPILFRQERPGREGRPFELLKFRTMRIAVDAEGYSLSDQERLTAFGQKLRTTSIDELPELWNVLKGDMSIVGPRPLLMSYLSHYSERQARRHEICPGITGLAQVNGRNLLSWDEKFEMDVWYVDNYSFNLDVRILWNTVVAVIRREGVSPLGQVTQSEFGKDG